MKHYEWDENNDSGMGAAFWGLGAWCLAVVAIVVLSW